MLSLLLYIQIFVLLANPLNPFHQKKNRSGHEIMEERNVSAELTDEHEELDVLLIQSFNTRAVGSNKHEQICIENITQDLGSENRLFTKNKTTVPFKKEGTVEVASTLLPSNETSLIANKDNQNYYNIALHHRGIHECTNVCIEVIKNCNLTNDTGNEKVAESSFLYIQNTIDELKNLTSEIRMLLEKGEEENTESTEVSERQESNENNGNSEVQTENLEGIKYVLLERQGVLKNKLSMRYDRHLEVVAKNISLLIEKIEMLLIRVEEINGTVIENNILTCNEEALITGIPPRTNNLCTNEETEDVTDTCQVEDGELEELDPERSTDAFSTVCAQCTMCIAVATKFNATFTSILDSVEFKQFPPVCLDLGDDWCQESFKSYSQLEINGVHNIMPKLNIFKIMDAQFQRNLAEELVEKCSLYRSLIPDQRLYRYWLDNNLDMVKTICRSDYAVEYKSCIPAFDDDGFFAVDFL